MLKRGLAFGGILAILSGVGIYNNIYAATEASTKFSVDINNAVLELTVPSNPAVIDLNPTMTNASFGSTSINIHVATNNITGYTLTMTPTNGTYDTSLIRTELIGDEEDYREIETLEQTDPISTGYTEQTFTTNAWGYKITGDNYYGIDINNTTVSHPAWTTNAPTNGTDHNLTLAAKVDADTVSGAYETTLNFNAVTNAVPLVTLEMSYGFHGKQKVTVNNEEYYKIQDMTTEICSYTNEIPSELQVVDIRDNKIYWIAKLADGHCWMTQNLDFDIPSGLLYSDTTDLTQFDTKGYTSAEGYSETNGLIAWQPLRPTISDSNINSDGTISGWSSSSYNPYSINVGDWYWTDTYYIATASVNINYLSESYDGDEFSTTEYIGNGKHGHIGNYYNYAASIASNNISFTYNDMSKIFENSICPANWRIPSSEDDFQRLMSSYRTTSTYPGDSDRDKDVVGSPLYLIRGGSFDNGFINSGAIGYYWGDRSSGSYQSKGLYFGSYYGVSTTRLLMKKEGSFIRCMAR